MQTHIEHILVPVDFGPASRQAFRDALTVARGYGARVTVLHVADEMSGLPGSPRMTRIPGQREIAVSDYERTRAQLELKRMVRDVPAEFDGVPIDIRLDTGTPHLCIAAAANEGGVDLIVMGTHARRGMEYVLVGSVAELVICRARCPVLTTRSAQERYGRH